MLLLVTACLVIGLISGYYGWSLAAGLGLYLAPGPSSNCCACTSGCACTNPMKPRPMAMACGAKCSTASITCKRRDQRVRGRLQAVIDRVQESTAALKDAVIMLDSDGNLEWWNRAAETLLGLKTPTGQRPAGDQPGAPPALQGILRAGQLRRAAGNPLADQRPHAHPAVPDPLRQQRAPDAGARRDPRPPARTDAQGLRRQRLPRAAHPADGD